MSASMVLFLAVILAFAALVTAHVLIVAGLFARHPRWHAPIALVVPPLAPYWAAREGMRVRSLVWLMGIVVYGVALYFSRT